MIRVVIVDDHPIVRDGIAAAFADAGDFAIAGKAGTMLEALNLVERTKPDVATVDLELPGARDVSLVAALRALARPPQVVVFSAYAGEERVQRALAAGAISYVRKGTPSDELVAIVRAAAAGESRLPPEIAAIVVNALRSPRGSQLTEREREILRLVASGHTNKAVASAIGITERTVKFHVGEILARLGASNRAQAVDLARERGLL